jgi:hypothetical protein
MVTGFGMPVSASRFVGTEALLLNINKAIDTAFRAAAHSQPLEFLALRDLRAREPAGVGTADDYCRWHNRPDWVDWLPPRHN